MANGAPGRKCKVLQLSRLLVVSLQKGRRRFFRAEISNRRGEGTEDGMSQFATALSQSY